MDTLLKLLLFVRILFQWLTTGRASFVACMLIPNGKHNNSDSHYSTVDDFVLKPGFRNKKKSAKYTNNKFILNR